MIGDEENLLYPIDWIEVTHLGMVAEEAAEKALGGALGMLRLGSWKRTSSERC